VQGNPYVFVGRAAKKPVSNLFKAWGRVLTAAGITTNTRIHDLRHSFASVGVGANMSLPIVGAILGHSKSVTTSRYAHLAQDPVAEATGKIAGTIAGHLDKTVEQPTDHSASGKPGAGENLLRFRKRPIRR
jgi:integrase